MDPARWHRLSSEFNACLDAGAEIRTKRLSELQQHDPELAQELQNMLAVAEESSPLDEKARLLFTDGVADDAEVFNLEWLGDWRVDYELGRGGMGVVFAGHRDEGDTRQRAAIKYLRSRWDGSAQTQRFLDERRILASLAHPNIPGLIDHGLDPDGRPWFAQQYIEGLPLMDYADSHLLSLRERIDLFRKVCAAVQHAHQHFVVHRDLKPSNILVDNDGQPHVLDFGVAKRIDAEEGMTRTGLYAGFTPEYAAPEQVSGGVISAATDVHALGVLLYQLLSGQLPFRFDSENLRAAADAIATRNAAPMERVITEGDKAAVERRMHVRSTDTESFRRFVRGDLWRIVQTALAKEPSRRYGSVQALSNDLKRFQEGRPVSVAGDTPGYRTRKFIQRNRWSVAMAALACCAVLAGLAATAWQLRETRVQRDAAVAEAQKSRAVREYLLKLFRDNGSADAKATDVLKQGVGNVLSSYQDNPRAGLEVANALGEIYAALSDNNGAAALFEQVIASPQGKYNLDQRATAQAALAGVEFSRGDLRRARQLLTDAQAFWKTDPKRFALPLNESRLVQSQLEREGGDPKAALRTLQSAADERLALTGGKPDRVGIGLRGSMTQSMWLLGDFKGGRAVSQQAFDEYKKLGLQDTPDALAALHNVVVSSAQMGDLIGAEAAGRQVYEARKRLYPDTADTAATAGNYGMILDLLGKHAESIAILREALDMATKSSGPHSRAALMSRQGLIQALLRARQIDEGERMVQEQFKLLGEFDASPDLWANVYRVRGGLRKLKHDRAGALTDLREAERRMIALGKIGEPLLPTIREEMKGL